ncbi:hypothetical protein [Deinococcus navajonensis]|uniref:Sensory transduction regulator n=1 Tax=Deinococcus navajonensis TaxID=309884 RepID=A0ABV8XUM1_9DEIO
MTDQKSARAARPPSKRPPAPLPKAPASPLSALKTSLEAQGFQLQEDPEAGLAFMFEGGQYYLPPQHDDEQFYHLLLPNFWALETDEEYGRALFACDAVNREAKLVKLHTADADVWAGIEALHPSPEAFLAALPRYLTFVQEAVRAFREVMLSTLDEGEEEAAES